MGFIYKITNTINDKVYIGKTTRTIKDKDFKIYRAFRKYGVKNFSIESIEECSNDIINEREIYWIDFYNSYEEGYNSTRGGEGTRFLTQKEISTIIDLYQNGYSKINQFNYRNNFFLYKTRIKTFRRRY